MTTTITEMKQTLSNYGYSEEILTSLSEKQIESKYKQICKKLTATISNSDDITCNSNSDSNKKMLQIPNDTSQQEYEKALKEHSKRINELLAKKDYLGALKEAVFNVPKNPNLIMGEAPCPAFGEFGFVKQLMNLLKNPKKLIAIAKAAKKYLVKSYEELLNVAKSFIVQSRPSYNLPKWVLFGRGSGACLDLAVEALRFGNDNKIKIPTKILLNAIKNLEQSGIKNVNPKSIKVVHMDFGQGKGEAIYFTYFNPKTGESIMLNAEGQLYGSVKYSYTKMGKLLDARIIPIGEKGENVSTRLAYGSAGVRIDGWSRFLDTYGDVIAPMARRGIEIPLGTPPFK